MRREDINKSGSMLTEGYEGGHDFHYCVTPPDLTRDHFTIFDCVKEHRVLDNISTFRRSGGSRKVTTFYCDEERVREPRTKPAAKPKRNRIEKKPKPMGRPSVVSLMLWTGTKVTSVVSQAVLRRLHKRQVVGAAWEAMKRDGFHSFKDGAVVWFSDRPMPAFVAIQQERGLLARATEMKAKEA